MSEDMIDIVIARILGEFSDKNYFEKLDDLESTVNEIKALFESNGDISCKNCTYSVEPNNFKCGECGQGYPEFKRKVEVK